MTILNNELQNNDIKNIKIKRIKKVLTHTIPVLNLHLMTESYLKNYKISLYKYWNVIVPKLGKACLQIIKNILYSVQIHDKAERNFSYVKTFFTLEFLHFLCYFYITHYCYL